MNTGFELGMALAFANNINPSNLTNYLSIFDSRRPSTPRFRPPYFQASVFWEFYPLFLEFFKNEANPMPFLDKRHQPMGIFRRFLLRLLDDRLWPLKISEEFSGGFSCGF